MAGRVSLAKVQPPVCEIPPGYPELPPEVYRERLGRLRKRMREAGLDWVVIYADREHAANFSYLAGFGPRFEEALLLVGPEDAGAPRAVLGNECIDMARFTEAELEGVHYPTFSLIGQPREDVKCLKEIFREAGIRRGMTVGTVGWKYFTVEDGCPEGSFEIPHFIVEAIREVVGDEAAGAEPDAGREGAVSGNRVRNATGMFMNPDNGLRTVLEPEQVAVFEYAACYVARSMLALMDNVEPGMTELEMASWLRSSGLPLSVHPMLSVGEKARFGLTSPTGRVARRGDFMTTAFGIDGALSCRAAYLAADESDLAPEVGDWLEKIAEPYFETAVNWLEMVRIGVEGREIWEMAKSRLPKAKFGWSLNPGHLIASDEWVSTPFTAGSEVRLKSGNYMQFDIIIAPRPPYFGANAEDGIVLADEELRAEIAAKFPDMRARFERRRRYVRETLGIGIADDVLPMSDILGYYRPFLLDRERAFVVR